MDLVTNLTKSLTDILSKNEERFNEQSKLNIDLQEQLKNLMEKNNQLVDDYNKLAIENKRLIEQQNQILDDNKKLNAKQNDLLEHNNRLKEEYKKLFDQHDLFSSENKSFIEQQAKLTDGLQSQIDVFNKHIRVEDISKWIKVNHGLATEVLRLSESIEKVEKKVEMLSNANENFSKHLDDQKQKLSSIATKLYSPHHQPMYRYGRYTQAGGIGGVVSPHAHSVIAGITNNNTDHHQHQLYQNQPLYKSSHYVETIDPNDELGVISDQVDDLRRSVNELNILQRSFEQSNSMYSDE